MFDIFGIQKKQKAFDAWLLAGGHLNHPHLLRAILATDAVTVNGYVVKRREVGVLRLPSGKFLATDPASFYEPEVVDPIVSDHVCANSKVFAFTASKGGDLRIACVGLSFNDNAVSQLVPACTARQRLLLQEKRVLPYIAVDSATVALLSIESAKFMTSSDYDFGFGGTSRLEPESMELFKEVVFADSTNAFLFSSGWGDGSYPTYFGLDHCGALCCFLIDCELLGKGQPDLKR